MMRIQAPMVSSWLAYVHGCQRKKNDEDSGSRGVIMARLRVVGMYEINDEDSGSHSVIMAGLRTWLAFMYLMMRIQAPMVSSWLVYVHGWHLCN
eukprot:7201781-Karenia_brevis.AAC.1